MSREFYTDLVTNGPFININGSYYTQRFSPSITFAGMVPPDRAEEALDLLLDEIQQLQSPDYYDEEGIELAKEELYRHRILAEETSRDVAVESMPFWWVVAGSLDYYVTYQDSLDVVEPFDISEFLESWIVNKPRAAFVLMPLDGEENQ